MILAPPRYARLEAGAGLTFDRLFRYAAAQHADDIALIDPPNREDFTAGAPRALTYAQADRAVTAIAARLCGLGLAPDHVVGVQLPNTVEGVLALLGVLRAGLVASPLPLLWRRADCAAALAAIGARALIATSRIGATDHCELAMYTAADAFTIRHVCMFGGSHDGVVPFDDALSEAAPAFAPPEPGADASAHVAMVTWDIDPAGPVPVARSHLELMMAGFEIMREGRFAAGTVILSSLCLGSLAGVATTLATWLLSRGTLVLHHPFEPAILRRQILDHECGAVIVPGSLAVRCAQAGMFRGSAVDKVMAVWRAPERLAACPTWPSPAPALIDVIAFGETGLFAAMRGVGGRPVGIRPGASPRPHRNPKALVLIEAAATPAGTVALRGPMVPLHPFPSAVDGGAAPRPGVEGRATRPAADANGFVDTFYPCRFAPGAGTITVTGPPAGIASVGGYRFVVARLQEAVSRIDPAAMIAAFPDALTGQRIAGIAPRREALQEELARLGLSPLVVNAFRPRRSADVRTVA
jgi:AMP-binding enzyme